MAEDKVDLEEILKDAHLPALMTALVHMTGDERWLEPPYKPKRDVRLIPDPHAGVPPEIQAEIRDAVEEGKRRIARLVAEGRALPIKG